MIKSQSFQSWKIQRSQLSLNFYREQYLSIKESLEQNKLFINMVVHDLRNPSNMIKFALKQVLDNSEQIKKVTKEVLIMFNKELKGLFLETSSIVNEVVQKLELLHTQHEKLKGELRKSKLQNRELRTDLAKAADKLKQLKVENLQALFPSLQSIPNELSEGNIPLFLRLDKVDLSPSRPGQSPCHCEKQVKTPRSFSPFSIQERSLFVKSRKEEFARNFEQESQ